jgi:hypothetical protein
MVDNVIRIRDLSQRLARVTLLPAPWLAGPFPQALHPYRLLQPSLDGGLPLFELFNPSRRSSSAAPRYQGRGEAGRGSVMDITNLSEVTGLKLPGTVEQEGSQ